MLSKRGCPDEGGNCCKRRKFIRSRTEIPDGEKLTFERNCGRGLLLPDGVENGVDGVSVHVDERKMVGKGETSLTIQQQGRLTLKTACRAKDLKKTVSGLSTEKKGAILEMGLGPLDSLGCCKLNRELCQMLVDNFDVQRCSINIHGRSLLIDEWDFNRIMGVRNGGTEVKIEESMAQPVMDALMSRLCDENKVITTDGLKKIVEECKEPDDTFKVAFAMYALATLLCPTTPGRVDPMLLFPLREPASIATKNWAAFCFRHLLEGVMSYKKNKDEYMSGCLLFLQIFYFDSVCYSTAIVPQSMVPVVAWTRTRSNSLIDWIIAHGGFKCTGINGKKRYMVKEEGINESNDVSTGFHSTLWQGISSAMSEVAAVKTDIAMLSSTLGRLEPNVCRLTDKFIEIKNSLGILKVGGMENIAAEVMKSLMERGLSTHFRVGEKGLHSFKEEIDGHISTDDIGKDTEQRKLSPSPIMGTEFCHESREKEVDIMVDAMVYERTRNDNLIGIEPPSCEITNEKFPILGNIPGKDKKILKFLFRKSGRGADKSREEVARFGEIGLSLEEIQSLRPKTALSSKVINISAAYLYEKDSNSWFFPTTFGEIASLEHGQPSLGVSVSSIIDSCGLRRFHRCLKRCTEILIPLKDDIKDHWFLLVMKLSHKNAELWDSQPDTGSGPRRVEKSRAAMLLLQHVFAHEMTKSGDVYYDFPSFTVSVPDGNPTNDNNHDSGIYVTRHMQSYREKWFEGYNPNEQRSVLALEIVKHPKNELLHEVTKAASGRLRRDQSGVGPSKYGKTKPATFAGAFIVKSRPYYQVRPPTGRKCRSHRKRSTRV